MYTKKKKEKCMNFMSVYQEKERKRELCIAECELHTHSSKHYK